MTELRDGFLCNILKLIPPLLLLIIASCSDPVFEASQKNKQYLLLLHNKERASNKLEQLSEDVELNQLAQKHAEWMGINSKLKHSKLKHSKLNSDKFNYMGENIAEGQDLEESVIKDWMNSEGHKKNILNKNYTNAGIGYIKVNGHHYWCVIFGG